MARITDIDEVACNEICTAVLKQALLDWVSLRRGVAIHNVSRSELYRFFRSDWARALAGNIDPMYLLRQVEALLAAGVPRGGVNA